MRALAWWTTGARSLRTDMRRRWYLYAALGVVWALAALRVLVYPTPIGSEPDHPDFDTQPLWQQVIVANGITNGTFMIAVNRIGTEEPLTFYGPNVEDSIHRSKAVGEPPLLLPFSVFFAIRDAVSAVGEHRVDPPLTAPATSEAILRAITAVQAG